MPSLENAAERTERKLSFRGHAVKNEAHDESTEYYPTPKDVIQLIGS